MVRSAIKSHTTEIIEGVIAQANSIGSLTNPTLKGDLRELLIADLFERFLIQDFGIGTGQIINQKEQLSNQIDIIIYDKRILPPFLQLKNRGIFPAESVIAVIEVKSDLTEDEIKDTSKKNEKLLHEIYDKDASYYDDLHYFKPLTSIIGFKDKLKYNYENTSENRNIIEKRLLSVAPNLWAVCLMGKFSWLRVMRDQGVVHLRSEYLENTKAYVAILLDNIRSNARDRYLRLLQRPHIDWFSLYIRDQPLDRLWARKHSRSSF
jgi:hypothetical protein